MIEDDDTPLMGTPLPYSGARCGNCNKPCDFSREVRYGTAIITYMWYCSERCQLLFESELGANN